MLLVLFSWPFPFQILGASLFDMSVDEATHNSNELRIWVGEVLGWCTQSFISEIPVTFSVLFGVHQIEGWDHNRIVIDFDCLPVWIVFAENRQKDWHLEQDVVRGDVCVGMKCTPIKTLLKLNGSQVIIVAFHWHMAVLRWKYGDFRYPGSLFLFC